MYLSYMQNCGGNRSLGRGRMRDMASRSWLGCSLVAILALALALAGAGGARPVPGVADAPTNGGGESEKTVAVLAGAPFAVVAGDEKNFIAFGGVGAAAGMGGAAGLGGGLFPGLGAGIGKYGGIGGGAGIGGIGGVIPVGGVGGLPGVLPGGLPGVLPGGLPTGLPGVHGVSGSIPVLPIPGSHDGGTPSGPGTGSGGLPLP
ncbi:hypothetical protein MLD38_036272 [Melastoma candidum]|uniref:Uncharacterized protein n=1 Tax=Melastoma candidum TaxID=119954 RepID=A0ACB9LJS0_9MYRT|nr:hypothetical protein MLD38_036272 [Melastoma candidum]